MNKNTYIKNAVRKIKCHSSRKKEIKRQLEADIEMRLEQGGTLEDIISEIGSPEEFADSFNESLPDAEKKKYRRCRLFQIILPLLILLAVTACLLYRFFPKTADIADSQYFDSTAVTDAMKETIDLLDKNDYAALQAMSDPKLASLITEETMADARKKISGDFGQRISFGPPYLVELTQNGAHFAVGEITAAYENTSVTYRLTYDENMKLTGLYMR